MGESDLKGKKPKEEGSAPFERDIDSDTCIEGSVEPPAEEASKSTKLQAIVLIFTLIAMFATAIATTMNKWVGIVILALLIFSALIFYFRLDKSSGEKKKISLISIITLLLVILLAVYMLFFTLLTNVLPTNSRAIQAELDSFTAQYNELRDAYDGLELELSSLNEKAFKEFTDSEEDDIKFQCEINGRTVEVKFTKGFAKVNPDNNKPTGYGEITSSGKYEIRFVDAKDFQCTYNENELVYKGSITDGLPDGMGILYHPGNDSKVWIMGVFENGEVKKAIQFDNNGVPLYYGDYFQGYNRNGEKLDLWDYEKNNQEEPTNIFWYAFSGEEFGLATKGMLFAPRENL